MIQAPRWFPYRLRAAVDQWRVERALREIHYTTPVVACDPTCASAEIHMLVCRRDMLVAALAIKSLLRFSDRKLAVTLSNDGSLTLADQEWFESHVIGCRWLPRRSQQDAVIEALRDRPYLRELYEGGFSLSCKLVHPVVLARCKRVILLDSDTAFFGMPSHLLRWAQGTDATAYYLHDCPEKERTVPQEVKDRLQQIVSDASSEERTWCLDYYFFNSGLLLFLPEHCDLDIAEAYLEWRAMHPGDESSEMSDIWFGEWTVEQTAYLMMFAAMAQPSMPLPAEYHLGPYVETCFNHFMRDHLVDPRTLAQLRRLIVKL